MTQNNPFRTPEFKRLFAEWNEKLEADGFIDAEDMSLPEPALKTWHNFKWAKGDEFHGQSYYGRASALLHDGFRFQSDLERRTWELHCSGLSVRQIEQALASQLLGYRGCKKTNVHEVIIRIQRMSRVKHE